MQADGLKSPDVSGQRIIRRMPQDRAVGSPGWLAQSCQNPSVIVHAVRFIAVNAGTVIVPNRIFSKTVKRKAKDNRKMSSHFVRSSTPDRWSSPRPYTDASLRQMKYGRVRPMEEPSLLARWFGQV